jgi:hypothetical protein
MQGDLKSRVAKVVTGTTYISTPKMEVLPPLPSYTRGGFKEQGTTLGIKPRYNRAAKSNGVSPHTSLGARRFWGAVLV